MSEIDGQLRAIHKELALLRQNQIFTYRLVNSLPNELLFALTSLQDEEKKRAAMKRRRRAMLDFSLILLVVLMLFGTIIGARAAEDIAPAQEFIPLPQPRPGTAPILPDAPLIYHKPGYFPQLDVTDRITLSLLPNLPPAEYDHPYQGRLRIIYLDAPQTVDRMCRLVALRGFMIPPGDKTYLGCAIRSDLVKLDPDADCVIFIMESISQLRYGQTLNGLMRHEIGHCNGWNNHNGIRDASDETPPYVPTGSKKPWMPVLQ
jgi:hypothetical protein